MSKHRSTVYYVFGNHMHWVDMEWLWGYYVLPDSVEDMLNYCRKTGTKANINFDAIGYEKLAAEAPEQAAALRNAIQAGTVEIVGGSYGQPYGLFHGGESNIRQRVFGVRTIKRILGVRTKTFWEEEFDFFPQLPQLLRGVGYEYASLFFQWTWHTPSIPEEETPSVFWKGLDGSTLLTATRNRLNLHQWPEDFEDLLESSVLETIPKPGIVQWLELMPSPDWMCRGELMIPSMRKLLQREDLEVIPATLSEYLETTRGQAETRTYTMDDVYHGVSLGKNGDLFRRLSRRGEETILAAEAISTFSGGFGRPYPGWNVYPIWEIEEAWRELLSAQHHDNDECEGICGHIGRTSYGRSYDIALHVLRRSLSSLAKRVAAPSSSLILYNPLGWERGGVAKFDDRTVCVDRVPPFGYRTITPEAVAVHTTESATVLREDGQWVSLSRNGMEVVVDRIDGTIAQIRCSEFPEGVFSSGHAHLGAIQAFYDGVSDEFEETVVTPISEGREPIIRIDRKNRNGSKVTVGVRLSAELDAVDISFASDNLEPPDPDLRSALHTFVPFPQDGITLIHDHPFGVTTVAAEGTYTRKYPTGEWMTSPQRYETVENPFTALSFVDLGDETRGILYLHDGSQAFARKSSGVVNVLSMNDPWDEDYFVPTLECNIRILPRGRISNTDRWKRAQEFTRPILSVLKPSLPRPSTPEKLDELPKEGSPVHCDGSSVVMTALYRESSSFVKELHEYPEEAGEFPIFLRIVELDGVSEAVNVKLPGKIHYCYRTNLLGEPSERLMPGEDGRTVTIVVRPHEVITLVFEAEGYEKELRNLDSFREVWARAHKEGEE